MSNRGRQVADAGQIRRLHEMGLTNAQIAMRVGIAKSGVGRVLASLVARSDSPPASRPERAPNLPPHALTEARRLRKAGWSFEGLARRYGVSAVAIKADLGEGA